VLPIELIDEGWRLNCDRASSPAAPFPFTAIFRDHSNEVIQTAAFASAEEAVAAAVVLEAWRQEQLEAREQAGDEEDQAPAPLPGEENNGYHASAPAEIMLELERIRMDGGTQQRVTLDQATITRYLEAMERGARFPPVDVYFDGEEYWLADGFYRCRARAKLGEKLIAANVQQGSLREAILFSLSANETHGLPRSNEDKRHAVLVMLADAEWSSWSNAYIAQVAHVSAPLVGKLRKELPKKENSIRKTRKGRVIDTTNIGKRATEEERADQRQLGLDQIPGAVVQEAKASAAAVATPGDKPEAIDHQEEELEAPAPMGDKICSVCGTKITARDYCDGEDRCAKCSPNTKKKSQRAATPRQVDQPKPAPTLAELFKDRTMTLVIGFAVKGTKLDVTCKFGTVVVANLFNSDLADQLPAPLLELMRGAVKKAKSNKKQKPAAPALRVSAPQVRAKKTQPAKPARGETGKRRISKPATTSTSKPGVKRNERGRTKQTTTSKANRGRGSAHRQGNTRRSKTGGRGQGKKS
jgi:hypothetical protein